MNGYKQQSPGWEGISDYETPIGGKVSQICNRLLYMLHQTKSSIFWSNSGFSEVLIFHFSSLIGKKNKMDIASSICNIHFLLIVDKNVPS